MTAEPPRLWASHHPHYGPDDGYQSWDSFEELRDWVDTTDPGLNLIYRWDWITRRYDALKVGGEPFTTDTLYLYGVQPRTCRLFSYGCPVTRDQEPEVAAWLRGPRILGYLREVWAPLLESDPVLEV